MKSTLKREIGLFSSLATVMGTIIGAGVFFKAATVYKLTESAGLGMLSWVLGGLITIFAGLTIAELAAAFPKTGGLVVYIEHTYGRFWSFLLGWSQSMIYFPATIAALSVIFGTQFVHLFGLDQSMAIFVGIAAMLSITAINALGAKVGARLQSFTLIAKLIPLAVIVFFGLMQEGKVDVLLLPVEVPETQSVFTALSSGLFATLFAYDGWLHVTNMGGEMKNPKRDLPLTIVLGLFLVMIVYLSVNYAFLLTLPIDQIAGNTHAASDVAAKLLGNSGGKLVTIGILISVYGGINGYLMTGTRIPYTLATENQLPGSKWLSKVTEHTQVPVNSSVMLTVISIVLMFFGGFDALADIGVFIIWLFFLLGIVAVFILRRREPELERPYKVFLYPLIPVLALLGGIFIIVNTIFTQTNLTIIAFVLAGIGVPVYLYQNYRNKDKVVSK